MRDAHAVHDAREIRDAGAVGRGRVGGSEVSIRKARAGVPQERETPPSQAAEPRGRVLGRSRSGKSPFGARRAGGRPIPSILASQPWESLRPLLVGEGNPTERLEKLKRYGELLLEWNRGVSNLISRHDETRLVERHLRESVEPARWMAESRREQWLDFGSGAGLPAIPLAIAGVGGRWTLVESRRTKTLFLRKALEEIGMDGIDVVLGRLEMLVEAHELEQTFDGFTSRATMALGPTLSMASRLVKQGGYAYLWKGSRRSEEMDRDTTWKEDWKVVEERGVGSELTTVVCFEKMN